MTPDVLVAAVAAPVIVLPVVQACVWAWPSLLAFHRAFTWPERLVIGLFVLTAALNVVRAVTH